MSSISDHISIGKKYPKENSTSTVSSQISEILEKRKSVLPKIEKRKDNCQKVFYNISKLVERMGDFLAEESNVTSPGYDTFEKIFEDIKNYAASAEELLENVDNCSKKFNRDTINIGFGGKKGTGKSYILQQLSGLTNNEVPSAGQGLPVTAVSSRIFNSEREVAKITFYTEKEFMTDVVAQYWRELYKTSPPRDIDNFAKNHLPACPSDTLHALHTKLTEIQDHIDEYRPLLTGEKRDFPLADIRKFVAYTDENNRSTFTYLAVKTADIYAPFPEIDVQNLGLIDLPGLGELNPTIEGRHTSGFANDVDTVMIIRRPFGTRVEWDEIDNSVFKTLRDGCPIKNHPEQFLVVVQNEAKCDPAVADVSYESVRKALMESYRIIRTTAVNTEDLSREVLQEVLSHLAISLPKMDEEILEEIEKKSAALFGEIEKCIRDVKSDLKGQMDRGYGFEKYDDTAEKILDDFTNYCETRYDEYEQNKGKEDSRIVDKIGEIKAKIDEYLDTGFNKPSKEEWIKYAVQRLKRQIGANIFVDTGNILRVFIADKFCDLDSNYLELVDELLGKIAQAFDEILPHFLQGDTPRERLEYLKNRIDEKDISMPIISEALETVLNLKIEHRTQFYPRAYEPIRKFRQYIANESMNRGDATYEEWANNIYDKLRDAADVTVTEMVDALKKETMNIHNIIIVSFEHFIDVICRKENAKRYWTRLASAFYDEIWGAESNAGGVTLGDITEIMQQLETACRMGE